MHIIKKVIFENLTSTVREIKILNNKLVISK